MRRPSPHLIRFLIALGTAVCVAACGSTSVTEISGPTTARCEATFSTAPAIPAAGGGVAVSVRTERECLWTATSEASWLQVAPTQGQGDASITITGTANPDALVRNGSVQVNGQRLTVSQDAAPCRFQWERDALDAPAAGGTLSARLQTLPSCTWTAQSSAPWIRLQAGSGRGSSDIVFTLDANTAQTRSGQIAVAGVTLRVTQIGRSTPQPTPVPPPPSPAPQPEPAPPPPPPPAPVCTFTLSPTSRNVDEDDTRRSVRVDTGRTCSWSAASGVSWIEIIEGASGIGDGEVEYRVERNRGREERTGTITVGGQTHTVTQEGDRRD